MLGQGTVILSRSASARLQPAAPQLKHPLLAAKL